jgi:dihydroneopterin aldolase
MDKIFLRELKAEAIIGIFYWERQVKQTIVIDVEFDANVRRAALSDSIDDTLNYKRVAKRILQFVEESSFHLVETLAEHIAMLLLEDFHLTWVRVGVSKPGAIRSSKSVGILIERETKDLNDWRLARSGK